MMIVAAAICNNNNNMDNCIHEKLVDEVTLEMRSFYDLQTVFSTVFKKNF